MQTQTQFSGPETRSFEKHVRIVYCETCTVLFGKTLSVMAGEAQHEGRWYGRSCCIAINWLLRDPDHCVNELKDFRNEPPTIH